MTSTDHRWESDPFFSAAEIVQDSADRLESIYRLLLHEQGLVDVDQPEPRLLAGIHYHRRHLATILETTKWQLEDFERAVSLPAAVDKSRITEAVVARHRQFIRAIREHINEVEQKLEEPSFGKSMRNSEWVNLNEQDRDGLALFLSGGIPTENGSHLYGEGSKSLRRFLDPTVASSSKDDRMIVEHGSRQNKGSEINGVMNFEHLHGSVKDNDLRKVGSQHSLILDSDARDSLCETSCGRNNNDGSWDLEADEAQPKTVFHENKLRGQISGLNICRYFSNIWNVYWSRAKRNYTKRLKDGEEERKSSPRNDIYHAAQDQFTGTRLASGNNHFCRFYCAFLTSAMHLCNWRRIAIHQRFPYNVHVNRHNIKMIMAALFTLTVLVILVCRIG